MPATNALSAKATATNEPSRAKSSATEVSVMSRNLVRGVVLVTSFAVALPPPKALTQPIATAVVPPATVTQTTVTQSTVTRSEPSAVAGFSVAQLDAMLAPIALYPDDLLT